MKKKISFTSNSNLGIRILFIAEGFTQNNKRLFQNACHRFKISVSRYFPFNVLSNYSMIEVASFFQPSEVRGIPYADKVRDKHGSLFNSVILRDGDSWKLDKNKVYQLLNRISFEKDTNEIKVENLIENGRMPRGEGSLIICILAPPLSLEESSSITIEGIPTEDEYYFIGTSIDGLWEQVIIKTIGGVFGLGDEFFPEENRTKVISIDLFAEYFNYRYPNLCYVSKENTLIQLVEKGWWRYFPKEILSEAAKLDNEANTKYLNENIYNYSQESLILEKVLGEDSDGFYRSSNSCMMNQSVFGGGPIYKHKFNFCKVCEGHLLNLIKNNILYLKKDSLRLTTRIPLQ